MDIVMPQMGESLTEGTVVRWLKAVGESVRMDEPLLEIETDKVETVIDSPAEGTLGQIFVESGVTVQVGAVIGRLTVIGEVVGTSAGSDPEPGLARSRAHFGHVDSSDVVSFEGRRRVVNVQNTPRKFTGSSEVPSDYIYQPDPRDLVALMSPTRRRIADHMTWSRRISAHATAFDEIEVGSMAEWLRQHKSPDNGLTWTAVVAHAAVICLGDFPAMNSSVIGESIAMRPYVNLGIAAAVDTDLVVPVIFDAHLHDLFELAAKIADVAARARARKLEVHEVRGGSFTYSNPGIAGGLYGTPIVNQPQVAVLSTNAVRERPWIVDGQVTARPVMGISLSFDHRVIDGLMAFEFVNALGRMLADPERLASLRLGKISIIDPIVEYDI